VAWLVPLTAAFYLAAGAAAAPAGGAYVLAAAAAALIPLTAAALIVATARKAAADGDHEDPFPGIGPDEDTPLGDTSEHADAGRVEPERRSDR
jgi:hypothetical protein